MLAYSKASRGLFVLVELGRVFTATAISPSESLRQLLARDAIRAGRNLPDKELRSSNTICVTLCCYLHAFAKSLCRHKVRTISSLKIKF